MSSSNLLAKMKSRNMLVTSVPQVEQEEDDLFQVEGRREQTNEGNVSQKDLDLLTDIRNFISFQVSCIFNLQNLKL